MLNEKKIIWLASYPKSGNTWFRSFITALRTNGEVDLNDMETDGIFSAKDTMEAVLDLDADYLSAQLIEKYQRIAYMHRGREAAHELFIKVHDAFLLSTNDGLPMLPESPTKAALYFVRNPLDVTLSFANHAGIEVDQVIKKYINNPDGRLVTKRSSANPQFIQPMGTWSMHVESWVKSPTFPVHFIRYEDMKANPFETFKKALDAIGQHYTDEQIHRALEETRFEKLKQKEEQSGFREKLRPESAFFFKGEVGRWKEELTNEQVEQIKEVNKPMMCHFNYIN